MCFPENLGNAKTEALLMRLKDCEFRIVSGKANLSFKRIELELRKYKESQLRDCCQELSKYFPSCKSPHITGKDIADCEEQLKWVRYYLAEAEQQRADALKDLNSLCPGAAFLRDGKLVLTSKLHNKPEENQKPNARKWLGWTTEDVKRIRESMIARDMAVSKPITPSTSVLTCFQYKPSK